MYDTILNTLLEEYEKNPQVNINALAQKIAQQLNLKFEPSRLEEICKLLDSFNNSYNDLINEKENNGISTESWLKREIISSASNAGLSDEDQTKVLEVVGEAIAINSDETLKTLNSHE